VSKKKINQLHSWQNSDSMVIDFTTGEVMDGKRYCSQLFGGPLQGIVFGSLAADKLEKVWAMVKRARIVEAANTADVALAA
jgi:hypothetical protein